MRKDRHMTDMIAARASRGAKELRLENIAIPELGPQDVLVRVASAGIAPGMMKLLERGFFKHLPTTPGHEIAGTVTVVGGEADGALLGRRIRVHPMLTCGHCDYCLSDREQMCSEAAMMGHAAFGSGPMELYARYHDGGLAEYVRVPSRLIDPLPDNVSFDVGAKIHDLANAVRALKLAALPSRGRLVIIAATGTMGTAAIKLARFYGARQLVLVGRSAERLDSVRSLTDLPTETVALDTLDSDWAHSGGLTRRLRDILPAGADAVIDFLPDGPGTAQATAALATGGTLVHMGGGQSPLPFALREIMVHCWRIVGTRGCTRADSSAVLELLASGQMQVDDLITHRFVLSRVNDALEAVRNRATPMWMTVVNPDATARSPDAKGGRS
jgi:threonine dehydrogenase-like Zn-dependent dehydrogenase